MFSSMANIDLLHIPYKGGAPAIVDLLSGRVSMMFEGGVTALPYVRQGKLRVLASTGLKRSEEAVPNLPTMNEILPGYDRTSWFGLFAPAGVPRPIIDKLNKEIVDIVQLPAVRKRFVGSGAEIASSTPEALGERLRTDLQQYAKTMREAGIQPE
jgi:tripartite-type tricarboxylate transporter receptor subunit TctC